MTTIGVFAGILDEEGRALCVRHNYGDREWGMPGGRLEVGEDPISAVKREIFEETGVVANITAFVGVYSAAYRDDMVLFFAGVPTERAQWSPSEEIMAAEFFPISSLPEPMGLNAKLRFSDLIAGTRGTIRTLWEPGCVDHELSIQ